MIHAFDSDNDSEASPRTNTTKKKSGRKVLWSDQALEDFVDIIVGNEYYKKKLIFTNTKKTAEWHHLW